MGEWNLKTAVIRAYISIVQSIESQIIINIINAMFSHRNFMSILFCRLVSGSRLPLWFYFTFAKIEASRFARSYSFHSNQTSN